ncbi:cell cycle checkpoint control protein RAD9B isoform X1 [Coturnix japonica]|uniref:cell cycle checkpoint control protein RAD9B isoform X1 n=1 Tax=Coturnix japonica TaxID=93934 RepID=UPI0007774530|nr:cell cycle checkpoint control protein RAD9B isoform X1 [Coturnix japonica]
MKCVIGGTQLRVFGRAVHAMARVSDEFCFDPIDRGLALRSVNSSRSAYAYVFFSSMFFQHYCCTAAPLPCQKEKQLSLACKLIIKSVLPIFRCVKVLEKHVEKCNIYTNAKDHHITFQLLCRNGVVKTHNLAFQECDPLQAVFAKQMCPNVLRAHCRLLADIMVHFPSGQEEVTLSVTPTRVCFRSYTEEDADFPKAMVTEIQLNPDEFDYIQVGVDSEVTFCLRELRGLLAFSEATSVPVSIHFDVPGKPVAFSIEDMVLEASFILATLSDITSETASQEPACTSQPQDSSKTRVDKSTNEGGSAEAVASKRPRRNGNTQSGASGAPASPLAKQVRSVPTVSYRDTAGMGRAAVMETDEQAPEAESPYHKFHSLFFGAVSCKEQDTSSHTVHSLATASDTEEDLGKTQSSQVV